MTVPTTDQDVERLTTLLKKTQSFPSISLLPEELSYLVTAFLPSQPSSLRSRAYIILSAFCQGVRNSSSGNNKESDASTESLTRIFTSSILPRLADDDETQFLAGISFLTALFQVDWPPAASIFQADGVIDFLMDSVELSPSLQLSLHIAHLLAQASGHKSCRALVSSKSWEWLNVTSRQTRDPSLQAAAAIALVKLSHGIAADGSESSTDDHSAVGDRDEELATAMKGMVISGSDASSLTDVIEGLAYMTTNPTIKETLSKDATFLSRLFSMTPRRKVTSSLNSEVNTTLLFGVLVIISNITSYRPQLTDEQAHIAKLKRMASAGVGQMSNDADILDDDKHVKKRVGRLVVAGVLDVLASITPGIESQGIRVNAGKALLNIVEDKENRGKALQSGCAKVLMLIIRRAMSTEGSQTMANAPAIDEVYLQPIQALAKLAITSSPVQVFGPNEGAVFDAIRPFSILLLHPAATLLQRFEAMMALTNLSSSSPEAASRVAKVDGLINKIELLLLEEHPLIRRAAMELVCNLIAGSDAIFERYGGASNPSTSKSKLQVLLALSDVDDLSTRLAASGALATLTAEPSACRNLLDLQHERHRVLPILTQLIDPSISSGGDISSEERGSEEYHPGLLHRGVICARNLLLSINDTDIRREISKEAEESGLKQALVNTIKRSDGMTESILQVAAGALKVLTDRQA